MRLLFTPAPADDPVRERIASAHSFLFVPGDRPDRFGKAHAFGADLVIIDLEDAVAAADKDEARVHAAAWLAQGYRAVLRVNGPGTPWFEADLAQAARHGSPVMVPKAEDPAVLAEITSRTAGRCALIALIETARGVRNAHEVSPAPGVVRLAFGNVDLATQLGVAPDDRLALTYARSQVVLAAAAEGLCPPVDGVTTALRDTDALAEDLAHARRLGFTGKLCIHPAQVPHVTEEFAPTEEELTWARAVLDAGDSVTTVDGQMVDKPVLERAQRLVDRATQSPIAS